MTVLFTSAHYLLSLEDLSPGFIRNRVAVLRKIGKADKPIRYGLVLISLLKVK